MEALVSTRCPVAEDDDAPEFMRDVPKTQLGDSLPLAAACEVFDRAGEACGRLDAASCAGRVTLLCLFDPGCCICKRFALPRLERLWQKFGWNPQCRVLAVGRGSGGGGLCGFREECRAAAEAGDRHIVELSLPMAPDLDKAVFGCFAEAIVPRFYLLGPDASIMYQQGGYDEQEFAAMEACLDQELTYM